MKTRRKKRSLTLIEIMIVIVLIGLIGTVIGVNMKGSLDEGRAFKTRQAKEQIADILMLAVAQGATIDQVITEREGVLTDSGLIKDPKKFLKDGWGVPFLVGRQGDRITVRSERLAAYNKNKKIKTEEDEETETVAESVTK